MVRSFLSRHARQLALACALALVVAAPVRAQAGRAAGGAILPPGTTGAGATEPADGSNSEPATVPPAPPLEELSSDLDEPLPEAAPPGENAADQRRSLNLQLQQNEVERSSVTLPWVTLIGGAVITAVSTVAATADTFSCEPGCEAQNWSAVGVVVGAFIATGGAIWLVRLNDDNAEVDLKRRAIEQDLQRLDARQQHARATAPAGARMSLRFSF